MRALLIGKFWVCLGVLTLATIENSAAATLSNPDFETGDLAGWTTEAVPLTVAVDTNETFNRNYAARIHGSYATGAPITNSLYQTLSVAPGDTVRAEGFIYWRDHLTSSTDATGMVRVSLSGDWGTSAQTWTATNGNWNYFNLVGSLPGVLNGSFESGVFGSWEMGMDDAAPAIVGTPVHGGVYALGMSGVWTNWSWNEARQLFSFEAGDLVTVSAKMFAKKLSCSGDWAVAGIKIEQDGGGFGLEDGRSNFDAVLGEWTDLSFQAVIPTTALYIVRCMLVGGQNGVTDADVVFDEVKMNVVHQGSAIDTNVTLRLDYIGDSGGSSYTSAVDVYMDSLMVGGSTAALEHPTNIFARLRARAAAVGTNSGVDIEESLFPGLNTFGFPGGDTNRVRHPTDFEMTVAGWQLRPFTNDSVLVVTNTIRSYRFKQSLGPGFIEIDQYCYYAKNPHKERFYDSEIITNASHINDPNANPYFTLGAQDGNSEEFGDGPFPNAHTYYVGTALSNFPRRIVTDYDGTWPTELRVVFYENFSIFTNGLFNKHFALYAVPTNGEAAEIKAVKVEYHVAKSSTNLASESQEIHLGWGAPDEVRGMVDFPNLTFQDHNEVSLRAPWIYNVVDDGTGWFMQQSPRGSATIEPLNIHIMEHGNWSQRMYEEYLFQWPAAASGVRSDFDGDLQKHLPGPASYHVGVKIGHQYGTNDFGDAQFPQVIEIRGNGYYRMTDYDGILGGSFRPLAADVFGIFQGREDAPLMPEIYLRVVPRTTPDSGPDDSYAELYSFSRSKSNNFFTSAMKVDMHFAPDEVEDEGVFFDLEAYTYANRDLVMSQHGPLSYFAQVDMNWRCGTNFTEINKGSEAHDFDVLMLHKADGEWITHQVLNPPTTMVHRTLGAFQEGDTAYLMQQDRGLDSYGYSPEQPYYKASSFEISMLDDGGRPLNLDLYEQYTDSEVNDNIVVACNLNEDVSEGTELHYKYRYRAVYGPGVVIINPNETSGGDNWCTNRYTIECYVTDGNEPLQADFYYGNGHDDDWTLINTNGFVMAGTNAHLVSFEWDVSEVPPGAYYIKATARRLSGGKVGFDISNTRLQVGSIAGFPNNGSTNSTVTTNGFALLGNDMSFESGSDDAWGTGPDQWHEASGDVDIETSSERAFDGAYSAKVEGGPWSGWSFNSLSQEVPCASGQTLNVSARIFIEQFDRLGTNWLHCGLKMESMSGPIDFHEVVLTTDSPQGGWLQVGFDRVPPQTGSERILFWVAGHDAGAVKVFIDELRIVSTNSTTVTTNEIRQGYWEGDVAVDVDGHDALSFWVDGSESNEAAHVWVCDAAGTTNSVCMTNYVQRIRPQPQKVDIPWTDFSTIDKTQVESLGFSEAPEESLNACKMRSLSAPCLVESTFVDPPALDQEGMPHYNPGDTVTNVLTFRNITGVAMTGLIIQVIQECGETRYWLDQSSHGIAPEYSASQWRGDRLLGQPVQRWSNLTIAAGAAIVLTNEYHVPVGKRIDHTLFAIPYGEDFYIQRCYATMAQVHVVVRKDNGDALYADDQAGYYSIDDDYDIDDDGLPDDFEEALVGDRFSAAPEGDDDGDHVTNEEELIAGTDAGDAASYPALVTLGAINGQALVSIDTVVGREYRIERTRSLEDPSWEPLSTTAINGDNTVQSFIDLDSDSGTNAFYRMGVQFHHSYWPQ